MLTEANPRLIRLIQAANERLMRGRSKVPPGFTEDFLAHALPEDLADFSADQIAGFVVSAFDLFKKRRPGHPSVRISDPKFALDGHHPLTLIEVVNDNMPFLVDSLVGEIQDWGARIRFIVHPILTVERDRRGQLIAYHGEAAKTDKPGASRESLIQVHVDRLASDRDREALAATLVEMLGEVRAAVRGWQPMLKRLESAIATYRSLPPFLPAGEMEEAIAFLEWLKDDNFIFLGMREYDFVGGRSRGRLERARLPGVGILSDPSVRILRRGKESVTTTPEIREFLMQPQPLIVTKANIRSRIHRRAYMDYIGIKLYADTGALAGELRILGLFTSAAYTRSIRSIPYLRRKIDQAIERSPFDRASHSGKALLNVLESYPRDELFQIDIDRLLDNASQIMRLEERPRIRVLSRRDRFDRFVSILVYVPRDRFNTDVRIRIGDYLANAFGGRVSAFYPSYPEGHFARIHFIIGGPTSADMAPDQATMEAAVAEIVSTWLDGLDDALVSTAAETAGALLDRYRSAFSPAYREIFAPAVAARDVAVFEELSIDRPIAIDFYRIAADLPSRVRLKIFHVANPIALSVRVPLLENMGFRVINERTYRIAPAGLDTPHYLHDMTLDSARGADIDLDGSGTKLEEGFLAVWHGEAESDGYNALIVNAGMVWRDIALLRAISRYQQQAGTPFSQDYQWMTMNRHPHIAQHILDLFKARFHPSAKSEKEAERIDGDIQTCLEQVSSLDEDRILRRFANVVMAMVRTNFYRPASERAFERVISFKLDSAKVDGLPKPHPFREIYIYSPRVEGVHLRFGPVARGGIRWSDRPQDFRTEVLGLAKAQEVKNAVIIPVGAKGGYVPKRLPAAGGRDEIFAEGKEAYRIFISSLLEITDNLDGKKVIHPKGVVRYEESDPYLVVAADKGTATFSDTANEISESHEFWLDDAFASGGSAGYDHKAMGITARGAWEAVKRHFREMDIDIQKTPFSVTGVGDMSGDVFGNGMLQSPQIRLVAAFDHRDIFIDPNPDIAASLAERKRMFRLRRSSWQDFNPAIISKGGGIFPRGAKSVPLSDEMKQLLGLTGRTATPADIISAILKADVDLLWFGGIGTYVRASDEANALIGDRANDTLRVTAAELRARVVGEGANLGMTQAARIEFGLAGGRCNSDAIDNSAGVNCSDVEVNIKIALRAAEKSDRLSRPRRNKLLTGMTEDVAALVLRNNYLQTLAISLAERHGASDLGHQLQLMQQLEWRGLLDRKLEVLPDDAEMAERLASGKPLTRAEIGVLLSHAKIALASDLVDSDVPDDPALDVELFTYFPVAMRKTYSAEISSHRLKREIIATQLANSMINRGGPAFTVRMEERCNASPAEIARAFLAAREVFDLVAINKSIDALDNKIPGRLQLELYAVSQTTVIAATLWFLRHASFKDGIGAVIESYSKAVRATAGLLGKVLSAAVEERIAKVAAHYVDHGVPKDLAEQMAQLPELVAALDVCLVATLSNRPFQRALTAFYAVASHFHIQLLEDEADNLALADHYDFLALDNARQVLSEAHRSITVAALAASDGRAFNLDTWLEPRAAAAEQVRALFTRMTDAEDLTVSRVAVVAAELADLTR